MPRFFFHIREGDRLVRDPEGGEFADLEAAHAEAIACARDLAAEQVRKGETLAGRFVEVADHHAITLASVAFLDVVKTGQ
jgi:hypothetical protein